MMNYEIVVKTSPRLVLASLVPFKYYVRVRYTGKTRIVYYDDKREVFRSSLLPKPDKPIDVRYSRYGLYKRGRSKTRLRKLAERFLASLPAERRTYRFLLRLSKLRKRGLSFYLSKLRSKIAKKLGLLAPAYLNRLVEEYKAERFELKPRGLSTSAKVLFYRLVGKAKAITLGDRVLILYYERGS